MDPLGELLTRLDRTVAAYQSAALSFTCREAIRWQGRDGNGRRRFNYVVTLDGQGSFEDHRTRARRRSRTDSPEQVEPTDLGVPVYLRSAWTWVFVFRRDRWPLHRYEIVDQEKVFGRPATVVRFEPLPPFRPGVNDWFGTAWIDGESAEVLRVEAHRAEDEETLRKVEAHAAGEGVSDWVYVVERVTTDFTVEARGLRYPGRVELRHESHDLMRGLEEWRRATRTILTVSQRYSHYRFFGVETTTDLESPER